MSNAWDFVPPIRQKHFSEPLGGLYPLERLDKGAYWELHEAELRRYFPQEVFFDLKALLSEDERRRRERLAAATGEEPLADFWAARDGRAVVAMFCGHKKDTTTYRMWHTHVHPDYRRRGLYADIVRRTLAYSRELGFDAVVSEHAPSTNPILIAKLKAGFRIVGMDIDAGVGPSMLLKYFHNEAHSRAYEYRCGMATLDERIVASGFGAMPLLIEQIGRASGDRG